MTELIKKGLVTIKDPYAYKLNELDINEEFSELMPTGKVIDLNLLCGGGEYVIGRPGLVSEQLLYVVLYYLRHVNSGKFKNEDTMLAIRHIEDAILRLEKRTQDRKKRGVLTKQEA